MGYGRIIKILVTVIKNAEQKQKYPFKLGIGFFKQIKLNCRAERHHSSMFNVGCSMFDVDLLKYAHMP